MFYRNQTADTHSNRIQREIFENQNTKINSAQP